MAELLVEDGELVLHLSRAEKVEGNPGICGCRSRRWSGSRCEQSAV